ncbi:hypothetical protein [Frankia sp. BMG5.23]|uniref:hypothetical protein n=1 Tax=Frankia sp. BMG5.23 TaxID=683305 RepID=UPI0004611966|nr:hypothetical protein [Frankia sp. BMG5.23]KDA41188.1 hypothetical protein BMG523Draft_03969 [Frankia sp. BMG5.23]
MAWIVLDVVVALIAAVALTYAHLGLRAARQAVASREHAPRVRGSAAPLHAEILDAVALLDGLAAALDNAAARSPGGDRFAREHALRVRQIRDRLWPESRPRPDDYGAADEWASALGRTFRVGATTPPPAS